MKLIDAAESGYASANSYFLLLWGIVAVVALTAFFELREIENERTEAERVVSLYADILRPAENVATALSTAVTASPSFSDPKALFAELKANAAAARALLKGLQDTVGDRRDLPVDLRVRINRAINPMFALLHFNLGQVTIADHPALLLAETDIGTIGIADTVAELPAPDAVRLLWLTTIPMRSLLSAAAQLRTDAVSSDPEAVERLAATLERFAERAGPQERRETARELWVEWLKLRPGGSASRDRVEAFQIDRLALGAPQALTEEAIRTLAVAEARRSGTGVDVKLPGLALPIRLSDALVFLPLALGFCYVAIYVYTARGLRYGTRENLEADANHQIVGKTPVYYALHGVSQFAGWWIAALALALPLAIVLVVPLLLIPNALQAGWPTWVFWLGMTFDLEMLFLLLLQATKVTELIDRGDVLLRE